MATRRTLLGALALTVSPMVSVAAPTASAQNLPAPASRLIQMATRIGTLSRRFEDLDELEVTPALQAEMDELVREFLAIEEAILDEPPTTPTEAIIVLMHATCSINIGNARMFGADVIKRGEFAARAATAVLIDTLGIDMEPFNQARYLPDYLLPANCGRA